MAAGALAGTALAVALRARQDERAHPPHGGFVTCEGVKLHYIDRGQGRPVVLIHGLGALIQDFEVSGLVDAAAAKFRVLAFDRPGAGYSARPRGRRWSIQAQADVLCQALRRIGVERPILVGHSLGALTVLAMALQRPSQFAGVVLLAGYCFPVPKPSLMPFMLNGWPVVGDLLRYTLTPLLCRIAAPALFARVFAPSPVPDRIRAFPVGLALRPSQLRAAAEDAASLRADAARLSRLYEQLRLPIVVVAGADDRIIRTDAHSIRLHRMLPQSEFLAVPGAGHMVHYVAPRLVVEAIERAAEPRGPEVVG